MDVDSQLYFIALVPPSPIQEDLMKLKVEMRDLFNSKASLNSPAHITLHMPFKWKEKKKNTLIEALSGISFPEFHLQISGFDRFEPRVIFADVDHPTELFSLQKKVSVVCQKLGLGDSTYRDKGFHPHITLGFRDLKKNIFPAAWSHFKQKKLETSFIVKEFVLLQHDGKLWHKHHTFLTN